MLVTREDSKVMTIYPQPQKPFSPPGFYQVHWYSEHKAAESELMAEIKIKY